MISRRGFLGLLGGAGLTVTGCGALVREVAGESLTSALPLPARFTVPLPIPATAVPVRPGHYEVVQRAAKVEIIPGTTTEIWGYDGTFCDDEDDALPLPKGERDIPLMICDRAFEEDGSFRYPSLDPTLLMRPGVDDAFMEGVEGDVILVNGAPWPFLEVDAVRYRLRLLNASNARRFRLRLTPGGRFVQVGSDQGLRRVRRRAADDSVIPKRLSQVEPVATAVTTRVFDFRRTGQGGGGSWTINGQRFRPGQPLATSRLNTSEIWRFTSDFHHPVHVHLARFRVLSRNGRPPAATDAGWKDTVDVRPYEVVDVLVRFEGYRGRYVLHCHNLEHEDMAMMADFEVV